jgi:2-polyprenyl-3-methyl-5-hydroxy-6-metoxy-1,4-benzoquinol methylase
VLAAIRYRYPWLRHVFADSGCAGGKLKLTLARMGKWAIQIVKRFIESAAAWLFIASVQRLARGIESR